MAKASVTLHCTECGTEYTITKNCYNRKEANSWEGYMEGNDGLCAECWKKEQQRKREEERIKLAETVNAKLTEAGVVLPELTGSERQIAWAADIRNKVVASLTKMGFKWDMITNKSYPEEVALEVARLFEASSKAWIESRGKRIFGLVVIE